MSQPKRLSFIESVANTAFGFCVGLALWHFGVRPLMHAGVMTVDDSIAVTAIFTVTSIVRNYVVRRIYNHLGRKQ